MLRWVEISCNCVNCLTIIVFFMHNDSNALLANCTQKHCFNLFIVFLFCQLVNLLTNDGQRLAETIIYMAALTATPYFLIVVCVVSCLIIGWTGVLGVLTFFLFVPLQVRRKILVAVAARKVLTSSRQLEPIFD